MTEPPAADEETPIRQYVPPGKQTAMAEDLTKAPACRLGEHKYCHGPRKNYAGGFTVPVETLRCSCPCHRPASGAVRPK